MARAIAQREAGAETVLVQKYGPGVMYILRRETDDRSTAEDLYQECFRIAIERLRNGELRESEKLAAFLVGIARHLLMAHRRSRRDAIGSSDPAEEAEAPSASPYEQVSRAQVADLVKRHIDALRRVRDRELLRRRYLMDEDKQSTCAVLGLTSQQYNRTLHRARQRLRRAIGDPPSLLLD